MWKRAILIGAGAASALVISAGCSSGDSTGNSANPGATTSASATAAPDSQEHNHADVMFAQHMIPHHQQAIEMSDIVSAKQGIDPRVTDLATADQGRAGSRDQADAGLARPVGKSGYAADDPG